MDAILCISFAPIFARPNLPTNGRSTFAALNKHKKERTKGKKMAVKMRRGIRRVVPWVLSPLTHLVWLRGEIDVTCRPLALENILRLFFFLAVTLCIWLIASILVTMVLMLLTWILQHYFFPHSVHLSYSLYYHYFYHHISLCFRCCHWRWWCYYYFHIRFLRYECWKFTLCYKYYDIIITLITELQLSYTDIRVL